MKRFVAVIRAGDKGLAFSPQVTTHGAGTEPSLLQRTYERVFPLVASPRRLFVVTPDRYAATVKEQLPTLPVANLLVEPADRGSAAALALASLLLYERHGTVVTGFFTADHNVTPPKTFHLAVRRAVKLAREKQGLVMIGVRPTKPSHDGYLQVGEAAGEHGFRVERFVTKLNGAQPSLESPDLFSYTGMFVGSTKLLLQELDTYAPDLMGPLRVAFETKTLSEVYGTLKKISIDHAVLEHTEKAFVVPGEFALAAPDHEVRP